MPSLLTRSSGIGSATKSGISSSSSSIFSGFSSLALVSENGQDSGFVSLGADSCASISGIFPPRLSIYSLEMIESKFYFSTEWETYSIIPNWINLPTETV